MITRIGIIKRLNGLTPEEYRKYWLEVHGPIASKIPGIRKYVQNHVVNSEQLGIDYPKSDLQIDGFSQIWFNDTENIKSVRKNTELLNDEEKFIQDLTVVNAKQNIVIPVTSNKPLIKRMSTLKRRPDVDRETFQREWAAVHSEFIKKIPNVRGYIQNHLIDQEVNQSDIEIDGIVELWFDDIQSLEEAFASKIGQKTMAHAETFIKEINTFLVEPHIIVNNQPSKI